MTMTPEEKLAMARECAHCKNGWFEDQRFGCDVECVNGILIDIDEAHEGWQRDVIYRVAPCHPMWSRQCAGDEDFPNDCQERLEEWRPMIDEVPNEDDIKRARLVFAHVNLIGELQRQAVERAFMAHRQATEARMQERVRAETERLQPPADVFDTAFVLQQIGRQATNTDIRKVAAWLLSTAIRETPHAEG